VFCGETIVPKGLRCSQLSFNFTVRFYWKGGNQMKRFLCYVLAVVFMLSMTACSQPASVDDSDDTESTISTSDDTSLDDETSEITDTDVSSPTDSTSSNSSGDSKNSSNNSGKSGKTTNKKATSTTSNLINKIPGIDSLKNNEKINLGGKTVKISKWYGFQNGDGTDEVYLLQAALNKQIEKMFNCKLEFVKADLSKLKASILAGSPMVDFFAIQGIDTFYDFYSSNCLLPLDSIKTLNIKDTNRFIITDLAEFNGKHYGVKQNAYGWLRRNFNNVLLCNFALTSKAGYSADTIYKWVNNKQWTWDKFEKVCKEVHSLGSQYYGLNDWDKKQMYNFDLSYEFYTSMLYSNNTDWIKKSGNKITFTGGSPDALTVLNKYTEWVKAGYIQFKDETYADFQNGKCAFLADIYPVSLIASWVSGDRNTDGVLPFPMGPKAKDYVTYDYQSLLIVIPRGVSNVNAIGAVLNAFVTPLYSNSDSRKICENTVLSKSNLEQSAKYMMSIYDNSAAGAYPASLYGVAAGLGVSNNKDKLGWYDYVYKVATGSMSAQQAIETFSNRANSVLASTFS